VTGKKGKGSVGLTEYPVVSCVHFFSSRDIPWKGNNDSLESV